MKQSDSPNADDPIRLPQRAERITHAVVMGASVRGIAQSAKRAGCKAIAVDYFADYDTKRAASTLSLAKPGTNSNNVPLDEIARLKQSELWPGSDRVLVAYGGGLENHPENVADLQTLGVLAGNPPEVLIGLQDKPGLHSFLNRNGFHVPLTLSLTEFRNRLADPKTSDDLPKQFLKKKWASCGGLDISHVSLNELKKHSESNHEQKYCYQEYVQGTNLSAAFVAWHELNKEEIPTIKTSLLGITQQLSGDSRFNAPPFHYTGSIVDAWPKLRWRHFAMRIGDVIAKEYGLIGLFNVDFVDCGGQCYFLEINPRHSSSMELLERCTGINYFFVQDCSSRTSNRYNSTPEDRHVADDFLESLSNRRQVTPGLYGKAIWYAERDYVMGESFPAWAIRQTDHGDMPLIADIPNPGTRIEAGSPVFTAFASGKSTSEVAENLVQTAKMFASKIKS